MWPFSAEARTMRAAEKRAAWRKRGRDTLAEAQRIADALHDSQPDSPFRLSVRLLLARAEDWDKQAEEQARRYIRHWQREIEDREYDQKVAQQPQP